jgi:hypothetical protein
MRMAITVAASKSKRSYNAAIEPLVTNAIRQKVNTAEKEYLRGQKEDNDFAVSNLRSSMTQLLNSNYWSEWRKEI